MFAKNMVLVVLILLPNAPSFAEGPTPSTKAPTPSTKAPTPSTKAPTPSIKAPTPSTKAPTPSTRTRTPAARALTGEHQKAFSRSTQTGARAIELVENIKEVREWKKLFGPKQFNPATNGRPGFSVEAHHGSVYTVYVFEDKPEQVLTFARYDVNIKTGKIKKLDE